MQGPGQPSPRRRAGDSANASGTPDGNLKDWQKNTWFGPAPTNTNPFEEPEDAPELLEYRSSDVNNHTGRFWNEEEPTGYQYSTAELKKQSARTGSGLKGGKKREHMISLRAAIIAVLLLVTAALVVFFGVFRIRNIRVVGNSVVSTADVIRFSGIRKGSSILLLSEDGVDGRMRDAVSDAVSKTGNFNYYRLQFRYIEKELPDTVVITVKERESCCFLNTRGLIYVMDKTGMVLWESEDMGMRDQMALVEVKGLVIPEGARVGETLMLSSEQAPVFKSLFMEMKVLGCTDQILEADLSNPYSILLTTRDHFTVSLGDSRNIHAKLRSMLLVREKLLEMGKTEGSIDVSNPESPSYSPSAPQ